MPATRRIDAHVHLWRVDRGDYFWMSPDNTRLYRDFGPADIVPLLEKTGMEEIVLVQAAPTVAETEFLLDIASRNDFVAGVVGWVDLESDGVEDALDRLRGHAGFKGIRPMIQDIDDPDWMLRPSVARGLRALERAGLAFDCLVKAVHLSRLRTLLGRHSGLRAIIDHGAKPDIASGAFEEWASHMAALAKDTHAYCKLSGLVTEAGEGWQPEMLAPYVEHLLEHFGPERLVFGSDWPVLTLAGSYESWYAIARKLLDPLSEADRDRIFGLNAVRFYRL